MIEEGVSISASGEKGDNGVANGGVINGVKIWRGDGIARMRGVMAK